MAAGDMDRFIFMGVGFAMMNLGVGMAIMPVRVIEVSRDHGETRAPTVGEVWRTRLAGIVVAAMSGYMLYALVTRMPGADFLTP
jgi:hypothetical protein